MQFRTRLSDENVDARILQRESSPRLNIPDNRGSGITDTIAINPDGVIASVKVTLDITHTYRGDLRVTLQAPWGDEIRLHERNQGGGADHIQRTLDEATLPTLAMLHGHSVREDWRLFVQDLAPVDVGALNRWALEFFTTALPQGEVVLEEAPGVHIPDNNAAGIQRSLSANVSGVIGSVEASVDLTHPFIGDLRISLRSPAGTEVILHDQTGGSADNVARTYTAANTAALGSLAGQPIQGAWRLHVADHLGQDVGKLNA